MTEPFYVFLGPFTLRAYVRTRRLYNRERRLTRARRSRVQWMSWSESLEHGHVVPMHQRRERTRYPR